MKDSWSDGVDSQHFNTQSGFEGLTLTKVPTTTSVQNVAFSDQIETHRVVVDSVMDPTRMLQDSTDADLSNFFSRPIKIASFDWGIGVDFFQAINPWALYFNNPRVVNRIINYNLLRAKLHIKIVVNGNGFFYGRAIASYLPLAAFDAYTANVALIPQTLVQVSQQPHVFINPTTSSGGEIVCPFFFHKNYMSIPGLDWNTMGSLTIRTINGLKHANDALDSVTISVFAWAEDVSLSVLTSVEPSGFSPQSGTEVDEANAKGSISGPSTALAKIASKLSMVPVIGPYAMATSNMAESVAGMAKLFGYSRPSVTSDPNPFKPIAVSELAMTTVPDCMSKFALDDKQELSIDPRIAGLGSGDPLSIVDIARKESYLTNFNWAMGTAPETLLWNARVSPVLWAESTGTPKSYHLPACAVAALPFRYWTGTMKFRFQLVTSSFHKGRVKVAYDPGYFSSNEYNTNYLRIVDIADTTDFTIEIGNGQEVTLLDHSNPGVDSVSTVYSTTNYTSREPGNGVISFYVVNELTTPNSTVDNSIRVNVYISAGDDFQVFVPEDIFQTLVFKPQAGTETSTIVPDGLGDTELDKPEDQLSLKMGPALTDLQDLNKVFTGESIRSFRQILKRYNLHTTIGCGATTRYRFDFQRRAFPFLRGNVSGAIHRDSADEPYNFANTIMLHWVTACFQGWRGSIRYKYLYRGKSSNPPTLYVSRTWDEADADAFSLAFAAYTSVNDAASSCVYSPAVDYKVPTGIQGASYRTGFINPSSEFEVPFYSSWRFMPGKFSTVGENSSYRGVFFSDGDATTALDVWTAIGEDFQTYMWTGMPPLYFESAPPAPL